MSRALLSGIGLVMFVLQGCASEPAGPAEGASVSLPVAGSYIATTLSTIHEGTATDQLAAGVQVRITLLPDGSTTGQIFVPASIVQQEVTLDLAGTWSLAGTTVSFKQAPETFVDWIPFRATVNHLRGDAMLGNTIIRVVFSRLDPETGEPIP